MTGTDTAAAGGHSVATLYEASGLPIACDPGLRPAWPGARLAGPAYTVRGVGGDNLALHNAVVTAPPGHVLVVDVQGATQGIGARSSPSPLRSAASSALSSTAASATSRSWPAWTSPSSPAW
jgi:regulator of RNase E activity RraA